MRAVNRFHPARRALRRVLPLLLVALLLAALLPGTAKAEDAALLQSGDLIYLGYFTDDSRLYGEPVSFPVSWLVLDAQHRNSGEAGVFLLSQYVVQQTGVRFDPALAEWQGSLAQQWCADFAQTAFTDAERALIPAVSKSEEPLPNYALNWAANELKDEQVFFLSAWEARDYIGPEGTPGLSAETPDGILTYWWFRSASFIHPDWSGLVLQGDDIHDSQVWEAWGARPAMNLDLSRALLLLPAQGQRDLGLIAAPERPAEGVWKLCVPDESRGLTLRAASLEDGRLRLAYEDAPMGEDEYLTLLVRSASGETLAWGRLARLEQAAGEVEADLGALALPEDAALYCFAEHEGGDYRTNTASPLCALKPLLEADRARREPEALAAAQAEAEAETGSSAESAPAAPNAAAQPDSARHSPLLWIVPAVLALLLCLVLLLRRRK